MPNYSKILIVKTSAIGDVLQTFPILDELRAHFPKAQIDWVVEQPSASLLEAHPFIDNTLVMNSKKWRRSPLTHRKEIRAFFHRLRETTYDLLIDLQGNAKSGLITLLANADCKAGYSLRSLPEKINALATNLRIDVPANLDVRSRYLFLTRALVGEKNRDAHEKRKRKRTTPPTLMVCFGTNWKNKMLSEQQLTALLEKIEAHCHPKFQFIYGNPAEEQVARTLEKKFTNSEALGGMTLLQWQQQMEKAHLILAMDSAALHLAATTSTPTFSLFGPSAMAAYKPPGEEHRAMQGACPYGVTFEKRCPRLRTCSTGACLRALAPEEIFSQLQEMLDRFLRLEEDDLLSESEDFIEVKPAH